MLRVACLSTVDNNWVFEKRKDYFEIYFLAFLVQKSEKNSILGLKVFGRVVEVGPCCSVQTHPCIFHFELWAFWVLTASQRMECTRPHPRNRGTPVWFGSGPTPPPSPGHISRNKQALGEFSTQGGGGSPSMGYRGKLRKIKYDMFLLFMEKVIIGKISMKFF
jgi:hypothetical protein